MDYKSSYQKHLGGHSYASDDPTFKLDFKDFFTKFDEDIKPLCKSEKQLKRLLIFAVEPYINNEWTEFVERVKEVTK